MLTNTLNRYNTLILSQRDVTKVLIGVCLMTVCANIQIPLQPVPITMQTVGLFFIALMYTPKNAFMAVLSYVLIGAAGAPIFAGFVGGPAKLLGPTAGYLIAMPIAAYVVSYLQKEIFQDKWFMMVTNTLIGTAIVFTLGVAWLGYFLGSAEKAITLGLLPFVLPGFIKAAVLAIAVSGLKKSLNDTK